MKFLLVALNAKYIHSNPAIYSLRAYAGEKYAPHVELAEYTINQQSDEILSDIYKRKPASVGFSCYIWNYKMVMEIATELHKVLPATDIWLGGPEVSFDAPEILQKYPFLTGIMVGEGEATFRDLMAYYVKNHQEAERAEDSDMKSVAALPENTAETPTESTLSDVLGLCLPGGYTAPRPLTDVSTLPFIYNDLDQFANKIIYYESSRGCPFRCSYCLSSIDKSVRFRDIEIVKQELQYFLDHKVKQVKFVDRTFNCSHEHTLAIWNYILENDNGVTNFHFEVSADILREDEIALLQQMRPGLVQLEIGVQTTNPCALQAINRNMDVDKLAEKVALLQEQKNVHLHLDLIAGLPYEDFESFQKSFNDVYRMHPEQLQLGFLKVLKGAEMWERAEEFGICYHEQPPYEVLYTNWISYEEIQKLKDVEQMVELYYNSGQFSHIMPLLEQVFETPFAMYEALAEYYRSEGLFVNSPARAYRYQVLLDFAENLWEKTPQSGIGKDYKKTEWGALCRELLTYDMYLRENLKSRPVFATEIAPHKEAVIRFYKEEEAEPKYLPGYRAYDWKQMSKLTHLEPFYYPVWEVFDACRENSAIEKDAGESSIKRLCKWTKAEAPTYVLFDYEERNPLTGDAKTVRV